MALPCPSKTALSNPRITRSAFRYFGGKWLLGGWIRSHFPRHACYVEPFGGAFSVGLQKQQVDSEIYSDLNVDTVNFFQVLQQESERLMDAIAHSPRTKAEFQFCQEPCDHPLEKAKRFYLYCQLAYIGGGGRWSHGLSSSRLSASTTWDVDHLSAIAQRIPTVQFLNSDALDCIQSYDSPGTLFYCDPPYPHSARGSKDKRHRDPVTPRRQYRHEMTDNDHQQLAEVLRGLRGRAIVSGYACPLYQELYLGWQRLEKVALTTSGEKRVECLWISPQPSKIVQVKLPPEQISLSELQLCEQLARLEQERNSLLNDGPIAAKGTWIETCRISRRKGWRQAMWKSSKPIFTPKRKRGDSEAFCKTQYIGKVGSSQHQQAVASISRRKQLTLIQNKIAHVEKQMGALIG